MNRIVVAVMCILFFVFIACTSCAVNYGVEQGSICVRNDSGNKGLVVREVYVKDKESEGYERIWKGNLSAGSCEFISVDDGNYSVKVLVSDGPVLAFIMNLQQAITFIKKFRVKTVFLLFLMEAEFSLKINN